MKYYLKITTTWFYDSHGSPDEGGIIKEVGTEFDYQGITIDGEYIYSEQYCNYLYSKDKTDLDELYGEKLYYLIPEDYEDIMEYSEMDGYNCQKETHSFKEITQEQYLEYLEIIGKYNNIK